MNKRVRHLVNFGSLALQREINKDSDIYMLANFKSKAVNDRMSGKTVKGKCNFMRENDSRRSVLSTTSDAASRPILSSRDGFSGGEGQEVPLIPYLPSSVEDSAHIVGRFSSMDLHEQDLHKGNRH